jgi:hypothetical protein
VRRHRAGRRGRRTDRRCAWSCATATGWSGTPPAGVADGSATVAPASRRRRHRRPLGPCVVAPPPHAARRRARACSTPRAVVDRAMSYTALREVSSRTGTCCVNGRPTFLRLVLDQGLWPDTGLTPPDAGCPAARPRADSGAGVQRGAQAPEDRGPALLRPGRRARDAPGLGRDAQRLPARRPGRPSGCCRSGPTSSPPTAATPPSSPGCRPTSPGACPAWPPTARSGPLAEALAAVARALDGTRPVSVNDGWETTGGDIVGVHDYEPGPRRSC